MIGGMLSTNAGGSNVLKYGNTRDLCLGLEVVLPNGEIMDIMSELHKDNSGYNLKHLMIGAEGTLGIITRLTVRLFGQPESIRAATCAFADVDGAVEAVATREANSRVLTVSSEDSALGEQHTRRLVLQFPPTESSRMRVSFESR